MRKEPCVGIASNATQAELLFELQSVELTYPCDVCGKVFFSSQSKYQHKQRCTKKSVCDKLKQDKEALCQEVVQLKQANQLLSEKLHMLTCKRDEKFYQAIVEKYLGGTHKTLSCGVTDVTSDTCHAEIKEWKCWKEAVGQLTCYNAVDPKDCLQLYLFGKYKQSCKDEVFKVTSTCNIQMFDFEEADGVVRIRMYPNSSIVYEHTL
jgi:hypothetical protein